MGIKIIIIYNVNSSGIAHNTRIIFLVDSVLFSIHGYFIRIVFRIGVGEDFIVMCSDLKKKKTKQKNCIIHHRIVRACVRTSACEDTRLLSSTYLRPHVHSATVAVAAHNSLLAHTYIPCILYIRERGDARAPTIIFFSIVFGSTSA